MISKKTILLSLLILFFIGNAFGDPVKEGVFKVKQPNGVEIRLILHGDERVHYHTTDDGYLAAKNKRGYYCYVKLSKDTLMVTMPHKIGITRRPSNATKPTDALLKKLYEQAERRWN